MAMGSHAKARCRLSVVERLESRDLLSADALVGPPAPPAQAPVGPVGPPTLAVQHLEISIVGTQVSYSSAGLPTDMKGTVYLSTVNGVSVATIGTYDESLQPIFAPVGPGGALEFVGATGICTFDFSVTVGKNSLTLGSITASDTAMIEGVDPDGTILVGSTNSPINGATGIFKGITGSFDGQSDVVMGATFAMHTTVDFTVRDRFDADLEETLTGLAIANSSVGQRGIPDHWAPVPANGDGPASHAALAQLDRLADHYAAVDGVFASESPLSRGHQVPS